MTNIDPSPIYQQRRPHSENFARVEVQVPSEDAPLLREIASALRDPERAMLTRAVLRKQIMMLRAGGLKTLLASAPLDGVEHERPHDFGRDVAL